jgi:dihydrofolate synthase/folylpolyglutamate synthase
MQRLQARSRRPAGGWELWLDGGHNPGAGLALAAHLDQWTDRPTHLVVGMKRSKAVAEFLAPLLPRAASLWAVAEPGQHLAVDPRRSSRRRAAWRGSGRGSRTRCAGSSRRPAGRPSGRGCAGPRADLRQPLPRGEVLKADGTLPT